MRTIDDKDIKLLKLYTIYMGYKLKYDEHSNLFYIIDGKGRMPKVYTSNGTKDVKTVSIPFK